MLYITALQIIFCSLHTKNIVVAQSLTDAVNNKLGEAQSNTLLYRISMVCIMLGGCTVYSIFKINNVGSVPSIYGDVGFYAIYTSLELITLLLLLWPTTLNNIVNWYVHGATAYNTIHI